MCVSVCVCIRGSQSVIELCERHSFYASARPNHVHAIAVLHLPHALSHLFAWSACPGAEAWSKLEGLTKSFFVPCSLVNMHGICHASTVAADKPAPGQQPSMGLNARMRPFQLGRRSGCHIRRQDVSCV